MKRNILSLSLLRGAAAAFALAVCVGLPLGASAQKLAKVDLPAGGVDTPENRLLKLRDAMPAATNVNERAYIISEAGKTGTFLGMTFAGQYLDDEKLAPVAAKAVAEIALAHPEYDGNNTRLLLLRSMPLLKGKQQKAARAMLKSPKADKGFVSAFNGKDLTGWKGLVENPITRARMTPDELLYKQVFADINMERDWKVVNGLICFDGKGYDNLCTKKKYGDFEMYIDWMLDPSGKEPDAGIYLRGTPQVQIWDISRTDVGAQVGSGGLYNNQTNRSTPTSVADNKLGQWNSFYIKMQGDKVTVLLNGVKVVDNVVLENYWDRNQAIFPVEQIELQAHGSLVYYRDIYIKGTPVD